MEREFRKFIASCHILHSLSKNQPRFYFKAIHGDFFEIERKACGIHFEGQISWTVYM